MIAYPVWKPLQRRRQIQVIKQGIREDPSGIHALSHLNQVCAYWGGNPRLDIKAAEAGEKVDLEDGTNCSISYPPRFYTLTGTPKGLVGEVKALMLAVGRQEGWIFRNSQESGRTELYSTHVGYRI